jgi:16S rRNA (cytidine1402-2'-O)-methyltransferase
MSRLFVVATPIGNLQDISPRALQVLTDVDVIAAEDTRTAKVLLNHYGISSRLLSYTEHNHGRRLPDILGYLDSGQDVAIVSDAGTPCISDPGVALVAAVRVAGHEVVAIPGPSAPIAALSISGLPTTSFMFAGFLPRTEGKLHELITSTGETTLVAFESPERLRKSLAVIADALPDLRLAVCRELTKRYEEVFLGTAAEALEHFAEPRGEIVIVLEGGASAAGKSQDAGTEMTEMKALGLTRQQAMPLLMSRHGIGRREAYDLWLRSEE